jgi:hypothetical protein
MAQQRNYEKNKWFKIAMFTGLPIFTTLFIMYINWAVNYDGNPMTIKYPLFFLLTWPGVVYTLFYTLKFSAEYFSKKKKKK